MVKLERERETNTLYQEIRGKENYQFHWSPTHYLLSFGKGKTYQWLPVSGEEVGIRVSVLESVATLDKDK